MRIGEFSRRTGVSQRLLRYYEERELLRPSRRPSGYREYTEADIATVGGIRLLLAAGLNTDTIARLLPCVVDDEGLMTPVCSGVLPDLSRERDRIDEAVARLLAARDTLDSLVAVTAPPGTERPEDCAAVGAVAEDAPVGGGSARERARSARVPRTPGARR
ncbi:MerR family transcriptional regulator [Streptomyces marincola]|uniref:MerR family transcriptional regulator n=1 Tax=Streptomyces marincola TaxID=2878388 RepID=A0A1W7D1V7_9ACTN|nr:MerR family transcriptional regulator [Streptomyces marincola]ARQ70937.1 MerR family transcriptional regulator [Streptomyces marincola]